MNNHSSLTRQLSRRLKPSLKLGLCFLTLMTITWLSPAAFSIQKEGKQRKEKKEKKDKGESALLAKQGGETRKIPEGATISGNTVTLQSGYKFVKQANGSVAVQRASGGVSGEFKCSCKKSATSQGSCDFSTLGGNTATCNNAGCSDCLLETVVKGSKVTAAAAGAGKHGVIQKQ